MHTTEHLSHIIICNRPSRPTEGTLISGSAVPHRRTSYSISDTGIAEDEQQQKNLQEEEKDNQGHERRKHH